MLPLIPLAIAALAIFATSCRKTEKEEAEPKHFASATPAKIVPDPNGMYLGAYVAPYPSSYTIRDFETSAGQKLDVIQKFLVFQSGLQFPEELAENAVKDKAVLFINLEPSSSPLKDIIDGKYDFYLKNNFAQGAKNFGGPLFVTFGSEMNGNWHKWVGPAEEYKEAFKHVHDAVNSVAPNITWVFAPNVTDNGRWPIEPFYPGDAYVDWVGLAGYHTKAYGNPCRTPAELFGGSIAILNEIAYGKPVMVEEFGIDRRTCDQAASFGPAFDYFAANGVKAVFYFNDDDPSPPPRDFQIDGERSQAAFKAALAGHGDLFARTILTSLGPMTNILAASSPVAMPEVALAFDNMVAMAPYGIRGAAVKKIDNVYIFRSTHSDHPTLIIEMNNAVVTGKTAFVLQLKGTLKDLGGGKMFPIVEIYSPDDAEDGPSIRLPISITASEDPNERYSMKLEEQTIRVPLKTAGGATISRVRMIRIVLSTPEGNSDLKIMNPRFE